MSEYKEDRASFGENRVAVIGGGASGLMAAIAAADAGARVDLFEKNEKPGKKLYATGNGRCNLTNLRMEGQCYHTGTEEGVETVVVPALERFSCEDLLSFFAQAGVPVHDRDGYVYPRTDQAETIVRALEKQLRLYGVRVRTGCPVEEILPARRAGRPGFTLKVRQDDGRNRKYSFDRVILCTGGLAGPAFGCSGDGYRFAESFFHSVASPLPALTKLVCSEPLLRRAAGVRCHAAITLYDGKRCIAREEGELQITEDSLSGIPVFQLSGTAAEALDRGRSLHAEIDFLPEFSQERYEAEVCRRLEEDRGQMAGSLFLGLVHKKVIDLLLARAGLQAEMKATRLSDGQLRDLFGQLRSFSVRIRETGSFGQAQVTRGGIPLTEIDEHFASRKCPGLYLAGELLDVDGRCGGYNLQWAMTSGVIAGRAAGGQKDSPEKPPT